MSTFYEVLDEYLGDADSVTDIRVTVRRCWFYDFDGYPTRVWNGRGKLFTTDGREWLGTVDAGGFDHHRVPAIQDGRDGSSGTYSFSLTIPDIPGQSPRQLYDELKEDQWRVTGRNLTCFLAIFGQDEALRPKTPIIYFKQLVMLPPRFSERLDQDKDGKVIRQYVVTVPTKDGNVGRSNKPNGTYADTIQKQRAKEHGVAVDRGSEFLALLANRTYQIP